MFTKILALVLLAALSIGFSSAQTLSGSRPGVPLTDIRGTGIALNLGDDSVSHNIPLGFNFSLFGKIFDSVWVSNNGVISFSNGNISGYNSAPLNTLGSEYNYALLPLWTDLINHTEANPYYRLGESTAIFGWYNSREYSNREATNNFEVQLWNNNAFEFRYSNVNLTRQGFTIGYTGDISAGEYVQWARFDGGGISLENFSFYSDPVNQCLINPLYSVNCEGYERAYLLQQCSINPLYNSQCPGYEQALLEQNCSANPLYSSLCSGYNEALFAYNCNQNQLYSTQCPGYSTALALSSNKTRETTGIMDQPVIEDTTKINPTSNNVGGIELSTTGEIVIPTGIPEVVSNNRQSISKEEKSENSRTGITPRILNIVRNVLENNNLVINNVIDTAIQQSVETNILSNENVYAQLSSNSTNNFTENTTTSQQFNSVNSTNRNSVVMVASTEFAKSETVSTTKENMTEFGSGVDFNSLTQTPSNFNSYLSNQLRDRQFYVPREIYRNQQPVDNRNLLRQLNGSSERRFQDLIEPQYRSRP